MKNIICILLLFLLITNCQQNQEGINPLETFEIAEGFQIELMAMEPLISDPVDMEIDELGRWFVVEMHGYPLDLTGSGKVKRLIDTDGDGIPDESTVFADSLVLPTGIMRWKNGFLVTDPPNVLYLEDTNDDGQADVREIMLTGFARSNPQHNVNNPEYGIDNWIYVSHEGAISSKNYEDMLGDRGSEVHYPNIPDAVSLPQNANGQFVKFKPDQGLVAMGSARGQFGHTFDPWGHHFLTSNASHLYHVVIDADYIQRNENLLIPTGRTYIPMSGRGFEIFPITQNPNHQLLTDVGMMTSACGIMWYKGGLFPSTYDNVIFTAEPTHNLVHADLINDLGATFESVNLFEEKEFLASTDSWFRPVNHYTGPDGAIYVIDYYRKIIEHPEWLSDQVIESGDLYAGVDRGRIYRISPSGSASPMFLDQLDLNSMTTGELIQLLNHENSWWRMHAQRLLMDRHDDELVSALKEAIMSQLNPTGKIHGMHILESKNGLSEEMLLDLLGDQLPQVRETAIKIAERRLQGSPELAEGLIAMVDDENAKVRYQLLLTLGALKSESAEKARNVLLMKDVEDEWVQLAALSAKGLNISSVYDQARITLSDKETTGTHLFFRRVSEIISRVSDDAEINRFITQILTANEEIWYLPIVLEGISRVDDLQINLSNIHLLEAKFTTHTDPEIRSKSIDLLHEIGYFDHDSNPLMVKAQNQTGNTQSDPAFLSDVLLVIAMTEADNQVMLFTSYLKPGVDPNIRNTAISAFEYIQDKHRLETLVEYWPNLLPEERVQAVRIMMDDNEGRRLILKSIESGKMQTTSLSWPNTVQLLNSREDDIRTNARRILKGNELGADSIWNQYKEALAINGKAGNGGNVFKQTCGICHQKGGENGIAFGPDLASVQNRSHSALLLDILEPNRSIADGFELWQLELSDGTVLPGIITNEGPSALTLRNAAGQEQTIDRSSIKSLTAFETSAMPQKLYAQISISEMADLLAYLKSN